MAAMYNVQHITRRQIRAARAKQRAARAANKQRRYSAAAVARHNPRTPQGLREPSAALAPAEAPEPDDQGDDDQGDDEAEVGATMARPGRALVVTLPSGQRLTCNLSYAGGQLAADVRFPGGGHWRAVVDLGAIRKEIVSALADRPGWGFSDIKRAASKLAKKVGVQRLAGAVYSAATSSPIQAGLKLVAPQLGLSAAALKKVGSLYQSAKSGSKPALKALKTIRSAAEAGNVTATRAAVALVYLRADDKARGALGLGRASGGPDFGAGRAVATMNNAYQLGLGVLAQAARAR